MLSISLSRSLDLSVLSNALLGEDIEEKLQQMYVHLHQPNGIHSQKCI